MKTEITTTKESRKPQYHAFHVKEGKAKDLNYWTRIGAYFAHGDEEGGTLILEYIPTVWDGRVVLRTPKKVEEEVTE